MAIPVGTWHVVTNLHSSILTITSVDAQGHITGTIQVGPSETHGVWDVGRDQEGAGIHLFAESGNRTDHSSAAYVYRLLVPRGWAGTLQSTAWACYDVTTLESPRWNLSEHIRIPRLPSKWLGRADGLKST